MSSSTPLKNFQHLLDISVNWLPDRLNYLNHVKVILSEKCKVVH